MAASTPGSKYLFAIIPGLWGVGCLHLHQMAEPRSFYIPALGTDEKKSTAGISRILDIGKNEIVRKIATSRRLNVRRPCLRGDRAGQHLLLGGVCVRYPSYFIVFSVSCVATGADL